MKKQKSKNKRDFIIINTRRIITKKVKKSKINKRYSIRKGLKKKSNIKRKIYKLLFIIINCMILFFSNGLNFTIRNNININIIDNKINTANKYVAIDNKIDITNKCVEIDNKKNISYYEDNIDFSGYSTNIKVIAIYLPNFYYNNINKSENSHSHTLKFLENIKPRFRGHHQPRIVGNKDYIEDYNLANLKVIKKQIQLAKSHGIYGFGIYYYWFSGKKIFDKPLNIFYERKLKFNYMLIWKNEKVINEKNEILLEEKFEENDSEKLIEEIWKYLIDKRYIKIDNKPVLGIYNPNIIPKLKGKILKMRQKARELKIGELYIIYAKNDLDNSYDIKLFDGAYKSPPNDIKQIHLTKNQRENYFYYYGLFYTNLISEKKANNLNLYKGSTVEWDNSAINNNNKIFGDYSPELFYIMNNLIINWTKNNYNKDNRIIFINAWNNYYEGTYLEPDSKYGYASINALSKALFNLPYKIINYNLTNLNNTCLVAIQAHIFYQELIKEVIDKTNNIPVKFDLYISTDTDSKMRYFKTYSEKHSHSNNIFINVFENKGKDVFPFLTQMKEVYAKYKYFCHIHSKNPNEPSFRNLWRVHLVENLLGSSELISEILSDFENNNNLGVIYPENFYKVVVYTMNVGYGDKKAMNYLLDKMFPGYYVSNKYFDFPAGSMFWARTEAVYQIFKLDLKNGVPKDVYDFLPYAIERIWLFVAKLNGFYYKRYFKYLT